MIPRPDPDIDPPAIVRTVDAFLDADLFTQDAVAFGPRNIEAAIECG
jgi:hypothetical protein